MTSVKHLAHMMKLTCSNGCVGIIVFTTTKRAVSISLTTKDTMDGRKVIIGTASNHASTPKLVHVTTEVTKVVLILKEAS